MTHPQRVQTHLGAFKVKKLHTLRNTLAHKTLFAETSTKDIWTRKAPAYLLTVLSALEIF